MNKIVTSKGIIVEKATSVTFCKNRLNDKNDNKCTLFLKSGVQSGSMECPYGFACARGPMTTYCGFLAASHGKRDLVKEKNKVFLFKSNQTKQSRKRKQSTKKKILQSKPEIITDEEHDMLIKAAYDIDYCSICSQTAHDLIHFSGQLKTLIDESLKYTQQNKTIDSIIREYRKYISSIDTYQKNSVSIGNRFNQISKPTIKETYEHWDQRKDNYDRLINAVSDIGIRVGKCLETIRPDDYKNQYALFSLISMQSLFDYRIKYHRVTLDELMGSRTAESLKVHKYNWHKIAKKLANILSYQARLKGINFSFVGSAYNSFLSKENVYLAFYILLENAVKYCLTSQNPDILLKFTDINGACIFEIRNASEYISPETLKNITEKSVSGENSKNMKSNGIGLFVAKKIFEDNRIAIDYDFDYEKSEFFIVVKASTCD